MDWTPQLRDFVVEHMDDDLDRLLFSAGRYPEIDMPVAVEQIEARRRLRNKLPEWYAAPDLIMGGRVPAEQCSSELTARYKRDLVVGRTLADLTGGMGVDFYYMSRGLESAVYVERQPHLCVAAKHNFKILGAGNVEVVEGDGMLLLLEADTIYLDPARRATDGSRVYDLVACEPDVVTNRQLLMERCRRLVIKISPMADLNRVLRLMPGISQIHVLAVRGECKEVLLVLDRDNAVDTVSIYCVDFKATGKIVFQFTCQEETDARSVFAETCGRYLYEPDVSVMKAGAFRCVGQRYGVSKLELNSHLYTSEELRSDFPGRIFQVEEVIAFASKTVKNLRRTIPQANITARNFPLTADKLRARTGIRDGGEVYLFATSLNKVGACLLKCRKYLLLLLFLLNSWLMAGGLYAKNDSVVSLEDLFKDLREEPFGQWYSGKPFVHLNKEVNMLLTPEIPSLSDTTDYEGTLWTFDSMIGEENWMGQNTLFLRFLSPAGRAYRVETEYSEIAQLDSTYSPVIAGIYSYDLIQTADTLLRGRTLYIMIHDDRIQWADSVAALVLSKKYVPVMIDSVGYGTESAPLRVFYSLEGVSASVCTVLPASKRAATSTPLHKVFSLINPRNGYPDITDECWDAICAGHLLQGMSATEVRLSLGRPEHFERHMTYGGVLERWFYRNGLILEMWDGHLQRFGM